MIISKMAAPLQKCAFACVLRNTIFNCIRVHKHYSSSSIKNILLKEDIGKAYCVEGWVKALQIHKGVTFIHVTDGSGPQHIQVVVPPIADNVELTYGCCVKVNGVLKKSEGKNQSVELLSSSVDVIGQCNPSVFPFHQRTKHSPRHARDFLHLRPKTNVFSALLRIRNAASMAVHSFFQEKDYVFIHTPILTSSDCEGACEVFQVEPLRSDLLTSGESSTDDEFDSSGQGPGVDQSDDKLEDMKSNYFFGRPAYLTVSGQLHLEVMTGAFTKVYNFGPAFRAQNTRGSFHLAEFYMVEAELAFIDKLDDLLIVMEQLVKHVYKSVMDECLEDVPVFTKFMSSSKNMINFNNIMDSSFARMSYTDAIKLLQNAKEDFHFKVSWGCDLKKEHEMYLTKVVGNLPVFVMDYPASIKPFYARRNDDGQTVSASDLLMPGVGELCGSSLREERTDVLECVMETQGLMKEIPWYLDLRKFGSCPHGGFGMGFERLLLAMLGAPSLKDVMPFPRWLKNCKT